MTEEQVRDLLARIVPEPPDSVTDPGPVVRAARRQRRIATTVVGAVAVLAVIGTVLGVQAVRDDDGPDYVDEPAQIADPYTTAPCPDLAAPWPDGAVTDLGAVTAVRHCTRPGEQGSPTILGPTDALVVGLDAFVASVRDIPDADPARCATVSMVPVNNRVVLELSDGRQITVGSGSCDDVEVEGRVIDGNSLVQVLLTSLREQRDAHDYSTTLPAPDVDWCGTHGGMSPAAPADEHLVAATWCGPNSPTKGGTVLDQGSLDRLDAAWRAAVPTDPDDLVECGDFAGGSGEHLLARTDRGDVVVLMDQGCDKLSFSPSTPDSGMGISTGTLSLDFAIDDLPAG